ncbi:MAG: pilus assembly protein TadG-related protein [Microvirga sp.]|nr:pilus assembly protein TadG-related protein [Microvirga sp.]
MRRFISDNRGNVALIFGLTLLPIMGFVGAAVDYSRATSVRESLRSASDQVAVAVASAETPVGAAAALTAAENSLRAEFGPTLRSISVAGSWLDSANYRVTIDARVATTVIGVMPGVDDVMSVGLETIVNRIAPKYRTLPPRMSLLEPEAGDYNRVYLYCFNPSRVNDRDKGRRGLTPIADNGTPTTDYQKKGANPLPECEPGEMVSYMMRNVRDARSNKKQWDDPKREVYEYYTDTTIDPNTRALSQNIRGYRVVNGQSWNPLNMVNSPIVETILCATEAQCKTVSQGGIIPNRRTNRNPATHVGACPEGSLMYFGWEDRPPGFGSSDRDYDDIRLVVSCPEIIQIQDKQVRIVK